MSATTTPFFQKPIPQLQIRDVTLRDGLQSLPQVLPTITKLKLLDALVAAGLTHIEVTSFMNPARVPQLADAEAVFKHALSLPITPYVLVANMRGFDRAVDAGAKHLNAVIAISEAYNKKGFNRTLAESIAEVRRMVEIANQYAAQGLKIELALSNAFHCYTEGYIAPSQVFAALDAFADLHVENIGIADTTGFSTPERVYALISALQAKYRGKTFGMHVHDTEGRAIVNSYAAMQLGVYKHDAALGGIGGSPFTPGVGGNLSLETIVNAGEASGLACHVGGEKLKSARKILADALASA